MADTKITAAAAPATLTDEEKIRAVKRVYYRRWYEKNREKRKEYHRKWQKQNREKVKEYKDKWYLKKYEEFTQGANNSD